MSRCERLLTLAVLASVTGCYFEGSIAYHPRISVPNDIARPGWSASANIGFYLDINGIPGPIQGIGAGVAVFNGYGIKQSKTEAGDSGSGVSARGDVVIGPRWLSGYLAHSFVFNYHWMGNIRPDVDGTAMFFGTGLDYRLPVQAWNGKMKNALFRLNVGVERFSVAGDSSTGIGARFMAVPAFIGRVARDTSPSPGSSSRAPSCSGGYFAESCTNGTCTTQWTCP